MYVINFMVAIIILIASVVFSVLGYRKIDDPRDGWSKSFTWGFIFLMLSFIFPMSFAFICVGGWAIVLIIEGAIICIPTVIILLQGMFNVPNQPNFNVAIVSRLGKVEWIEPETTFSKGMGLRFLLFRGKLYTVRLQIVQKLNYDREEEQIITSDGVTNFVPLSVTFTAGIKSKYGENTKYPEMKFENYFQYYKSGGGTLKVIKNFKGKDQLTDEAIVDLLDDKMGESMRAFGRKIRTQDTTWEDLQGTEDENTLVLIEMIAGEDLNKLNDPEEKKAMIEAVRKAKGMQTIESLGITLNRLNMGKVRLDPKFQESLNLKNIEIAKRKGQEIDQEFIRECLMKYMFVFENGKMKLDNNNKPISTGLDLSPEVIIRTIQSEKGTIKVDEHTERKVYSFDGDNLKLVGELLPIVIEAFKKKGVKVK